MFHGERFSILSPEYRSTGLFSDHLKRNGLSLGRAWADHDVEHPRLDYAIHVDIQDGKRVGSERELDCGFFAGLQTYATEAAQLLDWLGDRSYFLMDIQLSHFIAGASAGVGDVSFYGGGAAGSDGCRLDSNVVETKRGVAESEAEGEQGMAVGESVASIS